MLFLRRDLARTGKGELRHWRRGFRLEPEHFIAPTRKRARPALLDATLTGHSQSSVYALLDEPLLLTLA